MATSLQDSLAAIKKIATLFAPLATVSDDVDRLSALVAHDDELTKQIANKLNDKAQIDAAMAKKIADTDAEIARSKQVQADTEAGYQARRDALNAEYQAAKVATRNAIDNEKISADVEIKAMRADLETLKRSTASERASVTAAHNAFIEETKSHRAQIEANTQALQDTLDALRAELAPLMKD